MRRASGRIFTFLPLFVLIALSLLGCLVQGSVFAQSDAVARHSRQFMSKRSIVARQGDGQPDEGNGGNGGNGGDGRDVELSSSSSPTGSTSSSFGPSSVTTQSPTTSSRTSTTGLSSTSSFSTSSSELLSTTTSESSSSSTSSSLSSTSSLLTLTSSSSSSTSRTSSSSTSSSTTSSSTRTTLQVTSLPTSTSTSVVIATGIEDRPTSSASTRSVAETSAKATSSEAASSSGFLSNKGAMAGTFTVVGVVVVGAICAAILFIRKRKRSEDLDIFDTEYRDYSTGNVHGGADGNSDYFASDMTALSTNAISRADAHSAEPEYHHVDYGFGLPPSSTDRNSLASNHAGYGAFRAATEQRKPPMQSSGLRNEAAWSSDAAYAEPAVDERQSIHVVPNNSDAYYAAAVRVPGQAY